MATKPTDLPTQLPRLKQPATNVLKSYTANITGIEADVNAGAVKLELSRLEQNRTPQAKKVVDHFEGG